MSLQETSTAAETLPLSTGIEGVRVSGTATPSIRLTRRETVESESCSKQKSRATNLFFQENPEEQTTGSYKGIRTTTQRGAKEG